MESILIVKLSAIGDVVHSLPLLEVLKKNYPGARIDWLVEEDSSQILEGHECIDNLVVSRRKSWTRRFLGAGEKQLVLREIGHFLSRLRSEKYDLVIDLQGLFKSGILTGISRGRRKIGTTGGREGSVFFLTEPPYPVNYNQHALNRYLKIGKYLNCNSHSWKGDIPVEKRDKEKVNSIVESKGIKGKKLVAISPMAKWRTKLWEPHKFASLADRIKKDLGAEVIFTGSKGDGKAIEHILSMMDTRAVNLAGIINLKELACLYRICRAVVSTDTGPMHIAAATGYPVVIGLFGSTSPLRTGPYGEKNRVIRSGEECSPCFRKRCRDMSCMRNITVEMVYYAVREIIL